MFGNQRGRGDDRPGVPVMPASTGKRGLFSVIGPDVVVTGNVAATADLHIDGRIDGDVACASLTQGAASHIVGGVTAEAARIAGTIEGSVRVGQLTVESSARITGDVEYVAITIETGAQVDGRMRHIDPVPAATEVPVAILDPTPVEGAGSDLRLIG